MLKKSILQCTRGRALLRSAVRSPGPLTGQAYGLGFRSGCTFALGFGLVFRPRAFHRGPAACLDSADNKNLPSRRMPGAGFVVIVVAVAEGLKVLPLVEAVECLLSFGAGWVGFRGGFRLRKNLPTRLRVADGGE